MCTKKIQNSTIFENGGPVYCLIHNNGKLPRQYEPEIRTVPNLLLELIKFPSNENKLRSHLESEHSYFLPWKFEAH